MKYPIGIIMGSKSDWPTMSHAAEILDRLGAAGVRIRDVATEEAHLEDVFLRRVFPVLSPLAVDPAHPFPFISNLSINLLVSVRYPSSEHSYLNRIKIPTSADLPRFVRVGKKHTYILLEDLVGNVLGDQWLQRRVLVGIRVTAVDHDVGPQPCL